MTDIGFINESMVRDAFCLPTEHEPIEVELKGGNNDLEGIVQLTYNGEEGGICALHFNDQSASMICRMLTRNPEWVKWLWHMVV